MVGSALDEYSTPLSVVRDPLADGYEVPLREQLDRLLSVQRLFDLARGERVDVAGQDEP
jgi:hypothetical protein